MSVRNIISACTLVSGSISKISYNNSMINDRDSYFSTVDETKTMELVYQDEFDLEGKNHEINIYEKQSEVCENGISEESADNEKYSQIEAIVLIDEKSPKTRASSDETWKYFNNALTMKFTVVFSVYNDGSSTANYYKLSRLSSSVVNINSGYTMV